MIDFNCFIGPWAFYPTYVETIDQLKALHAKNGITKGYSSGPNKGKFGVGFDVLRKDIVTFLYRYDNL
jgi:hypothetical protein